MKIKFKPTKFTSPVQPHDLLTKIKNKKLQPMSRGHYVLEEVSFYRGLGFQVGMTIKPAGPLSWSRGHYVLEFHMICYGPSSNPIWDL